jgi:hypothetical protein
MTAPTSHHAATLPEIITVYVPLAVRKRGGRKVMFFPEGPSRIRTRQPMTDDALLKAIVRAFRWRDLLETGAHTSIAELASAESVDPSYIGRVLRLTCLAPQVVEAVLNGISEVNLTLQAATLLCRDASWEEHRLSTK